MVRRASAPRRTHVLVEVKKSSEMEIPRVFIGFPRGAGSSPTRDKARGGGI